MARLRRVDKFGRFSFDVHAALNHSESLGDRNSNCNRDGGHLGSLDDAANMGTPGLSRRHQLKSLDAGYVAQGVLNSRDVSRGVVFEFCVGLARIGVCAARLPEVKR